MLTDERTQPQQLSEEALVREKLNKRSQGQIACAKADVDVKLRRALLRQFRGQEEDLSAGERCLYWREANNRFHTVRWKGPAVVVAVQRDPNSGQVACYWLAHGTVLIRAGKQHVKRLLDQEGRMASSTEALEGLRQRRVVRVLDLPQLNRRTLQEIDPEDEVGRPLEIYGGQEGRVSFHLRERCLAFGGIPGDSGCISNHESKICSEVGE